MTQQVAITLEAVGEQVTWELMKCEGVWYVWASHDQFKFSGSAMSLEYAVLKTAALVLKHGPGWVKK